MERAHTQTAPRATVLLKLDWIFFPLFIFNSLFPFSDMVHTLSHAREDKIDRRRAPILYDRPTSFSLSLAACLSPPPHVERTTWMFPDGLCFPNASRIVLHNTARTSLPPRPPPPGCEIIIIILFILSRCLYGLLSIQHPIALLHFTVVVFFLFLLFVLLLYRAALGGLPVGYYNNNNNKTSYCYYHLSRWQVITNRQRYACTYLVLITIIPSMYIRHVKKVGIIL